MDVAVVGGGIAGTFASLLLKKSGFDVTLFERSNSLGGCAGSFIRGGVEFKAGATTIPGLQPSFPVYALFKETGIKQHFKILDPSIIVVSPRGTVRRYLSLDRTIEEINEVYPNKGHVKFWKRVYDVTFGFFESLPTFDLSSGRSILSTLKYLKWASLRFGHLYLTPALSYLKRYYDRLDRDYIEFINSQLMITAQTRIDDINALIMLLSLGYPFSGISDQNFDFRGIADDIKERGSELLLSSPVEGILKTRDGYVLHSNANSHRFSKVVLAYPFLEETQVIGDEKIKRYLESFSPLLNDNGALILYGVVRDLKAQGAFYLLIDLDISPLISREIFISLYPTKNPLRTAFTVSTHTKVSDWLRLDRETYGSVKEMLRSLILQVVSQTFQIDSGQIEESFVATPLTFKRFLGRFNAGGIIVSRKNHFLNIPPNVTPFKGLYLCGDMSFGYQGWLGISVGLANLLNGIKFR
ncbi:MAG: FAD-dependent oxidoreductase [Thermodesulfovibrionales bacterium]